MSYMDSMPKVDERSLGGIFDKFGKEIKSESCWFWYIYIFFLCQGSPTVLHDESLCAYLTGIGVDPENAASLVVAWKLKCKTMGEIKRTEFIAGWTENRLDFVLTCFTLWICMNEQRWYSPRNEKRCQRLGSSVVNTQHASVCGILSISIWFLQGQWWNQTARFFKLGCFVEYQCNVWQIWMSHVKYGQWFWDRILLFCPNGLRFSRSVCLKNFLLTHHICIGA